MVSHAMGEINGQESTNAYEAFLVIMKKDTAFLKLL